MLGCLLPAFALLCSPYRDVISRPLRMAPYWQLHICYWRSPSVAAPGPILVRRPLCSLRGCPGWRFWTGDFWSGHTVKERSGNGRREGAQRESWGCSNHKWKWRRGTLIDSCLAWCLLRLFPPSTAIINRRTSPSPWQGLCHPSPLEDAIPFGRRWIGVPLLRMRSVWTESLQREHSGVNRLNVNNSIFDISVRKKKQKNAPPQSSS